MLPRESRNSRRQRRTRRRTDLAALEALEERTLLSFTTLGFSLPDLTISGQAGPRAAWGGSLNVSVYLQNIGASTHHRAAVAVAADRAAGNGLTLQFDQLRRRAQFDRRGLAHADSQAP